MQNCTTSDLPRMTFSTFACNAAIFSRDWFSGRGCRAISYLLYVRGEGTVRSIGLTKSVPDAFSASIRHRMPMHRSDPAHEPAARPDLRPQVSAPIRRSFGHLTSVI